MNRFEFGMQDMKLIKAASKIHMITEDEYNRGLENPPIIFKIRLWLCRHLGWHKAPSKMKCQYGQLSGICPICGKDVILDSQGNWF